MQEVRAVNKVESTPKTVRIVSANLERRLTGGLGVGGRAEKGLGGM
jgi:hypothetical protein